MYKANPNVLKTPIADGNILLLEPQDGLYFELNETSVLIYQNIIDGLSESEILVNILQEFDIDESIAYRDVSDLIATLLKNKIITEK